MNIYYWEADLSKPAKVKEKWSIIQFDVFVLSFSSFQCLRQISIINGSGACYFLQASD